jgi:hypothetical protein
LNLFAILAKKRIGLSGQDMNRKFQPREESEDPDNKVVGLAKSLMDQADIILNLYQGYGFYSPVWVGGWFPFLVGSKSYNDIGKEFSIRQGSQLVLQKDGKRIATF